jgi:hypothetical protein
MTMTATGFSVTRQRVQRILAVQLLRTIRRRSAVTLIVALMAGGGTPVTEAKTTAFQRLEGRAAAASLGSETGSISSTEFLVAEAMKVAETERRLARVVIYRLEFQGTTIRDALEFLERQSAEFDKFDRADVRFLIGEGDEHRV